MPEKQERGTQTEISFSPMRYRYFMISQAEMEEIYKMHTVNVRLESVISAEGAAKFITKGKLSEVLNSFTDDGLLRDKFSQENIYNYRQLREDLKTMLTNYTLEVTKGKEMVREIQKLEAEKNLLTQKFYSLNDVSLFLDRQVTHDASENCSILTTGLYTWNSELFRCKQRTIRIIYSNLCF